MGTCMVVSWRVCDGDFYGSFWRVCDVDLVSQGGAGGVYGVIVVGDSCRVYGPSFSPTPPPRSTTRRRRRRRGRSGR